MKEKKVFTLENNKTNCKVQTPQFRIGARYVFNDLAMESLNVGHTRTFIHHIAIMEVRNAKCFSLQVIAAEGEQKASKSLREASEIIAQSPSALQLRYLQVRMRLIITSLHGEGLSVDPPRSAGLVLSVGRCESNSNSLGIAKRPAERN